MKVAFFSGSRSEYGLLNPLIDEISADPYFNPYLIISGSHLIESFGYTISEMTLNNIRTYKIETMSSVTIDVAEILGKLIVDLTEIINKDRPSLVFIAGDRYESFAAAISAYYLNIPIAHMFGGDKSQGGHLDDSIRHSITKLSHIHFTTNEDSYNRVLKLGEEKWRVFNVGSTFLDNVVSGNYEKPEDVARLLRIDISKPIILFTQHPVTTESHLSYKQVKESLEALNELEYQTIITYPCNDKGSREIIQAINEYRYNKKFIIKKSLGWKLYLGCLNIPTCVVVGNSSSGLIETPFFKIPCVNVGLRQEGRLRAENVIDVGYDRNEIASAINKCINDESFKKIINNCTNPYGDGNASKRIVHMLKSLEYDKILLQKKITY